MLAFSFINGFFCISCLTRSFIAFSGKNRILGVAAKNQQVTNMRNTVFGLKRILGRKFRDPQVQKEMHLLPFIIIETSNGGVGIKVCHTPVFYE